jgi:hypothetical protein
VRICRALLCGEEVLYRERQTRALDSFHASRPRLH